VFNTLHGGLGENGGVQAVLEAAGLAYTGSGILASAIAMDKHVSKVMFRQAGIPTADWITGMPGEISLERVTREIGFPCIVKPVDQGSSVGVCKIDEACEYAERLAVAGSYGSPVMVERYIPGRELSVPVLDGTALPVIEIRPKHGIYDYECKYTGGMSEYFVPAPIPDSLSLTLGRMAIEVFRVLGLRDIARIDFRLNAAGDPVCFEANTLPGMTATSLVPKSAASTGLAFPELVSRIVELALKRKGMG
jgi:D-alanine-D-alanine ligase